jgi:hypothetical protein
MAYHPRPRSLAPLLLLATVPSLLAFDYGTPIIVRSEADIIELEYMGEIDEELRDQLLDLYDNPLDLNTANREDLVLLPEVTYSLADRIIEHRDRDPFDSSRGLRDIVGRSIWNQVKPFVTTMKVPQPPEPLKGTISVRYLDKFDDGKPPVASLKAKVRYHRWLEAGVLLAEEQGLYGVSYDNASPITVEGVRPVVSLERVYASVDRGGWAVIMGHYKAGFGQRLTFDVTDKQRPHGFYQDLTYTEDYEGYDSYSVSRRLLGVAASTERQLGEEGPRLDLTFFASSNPHDLYQGYFTPNDHVLPDGTKTAYPTFPWLYREDIVGLNASLFWAKRIHAGFTGWGGHVDKAFDFDFTNTPIPNRDYYGALGLDGAYGIGMFDVFGEVALTDSGGLGARAETVVDQGMVEASVAMRYYGTDFDNPHSRGKSEPDQYSKDDSYSEYDYILSGGDRDRDEVGPQVQVIFDPYGWIRLRAKGDIWHVPSEEITHSYVEARLDIDPIDYVGFDVVAYMRDKDIAVGGHDQDYEDSDGKGAKNALGAGFTLQPTEPLIVQVFAKQVWEDSSTYDGEFMNDRYAWGKIIWDPMESLELTGRAKWYDERIDIDGTGVEYWSAYGQVRGKLFRKLTLFARYEQEHVLYPAAEDSPGPTEHKLKVGSDFRF